MGQVFDPTYAAHACVLWWCMRVFLVPLIVCAFAVAQASAHDPTGKWAREAPNLGPWFNSLASGKGPCCSFADGEKVEDVDWDTEKDGVGVIHYRVFLLGAWHTVPDDALITDPNRFGPAIVWPVYSTGSNGEKELNFIRCFIPGAGA